MHPRRHRRPVIVLLVAAHLTGAFFPALRACGPWLPEQILTSRQAILRTPVGDFAQEVAALTEADGAPALPPGCVRRPWSPHPPPEDTASDTEVAARAKLVGKELTELRTALAEGGASAASADDTVAAYQVFRLELDAATDPGSSFGAPPEDASVPFDERARRLRAKEPAAPTAGLFALPPTLARGLPGEWAEYLEGAWRFRHADLPGARTAWERVLARPSAERRYCAVRAAYMLARIQEDFTVPAAENARRYQRVRQLVAEGCRDLYGLASASFGWEAGRAFYDEDLASAARLYYLQAATGGTAADPDSLNSCLREVAAEIVSADARAASVRDPFLRRVGTLYVACHRRFGEERSHFVLPLPPRPDESRDDADAHEIARAWLAALTGAGVDQVREASSVAWAAYQEADFAQAAAWLEKAPADNGLALWLRAKMALREGKTDAAARFFARAVHHYPATARGLVNAIDNSTELADDGAAFRTSQFQADLGIISLARHDYTQALTALLRSGFWNDAAYVAERVLTVDELLAYVRTNFPHDPPPSEPAPPAERYGEAEDRFSGWYSPPLGPLESLQERLTPIHSANPAAYSLRHLLARRLARAGRTAEAREFYPALLRPKFDEYVAARELGDDLRQPRARRAEALWRAAKLTRWLGMEFFGSEDEPDWYAYNGSYEGGSYREDRLGHSSGHSEWGEPAPTPLPAQIPPVATREQSRIARDQIRPEKRFHYRYRAADLAWRAASLMPDQQDRTIYVLAAGGWWLRSLQEDEAADRFYQAIVRRCGRTALGQQVDRSRTLPDVLHEDP